MRRLLFLLLLVSTGLHAQSTQADLEARLIKKPLYLRGQWRDDKLKFGPDGHLIGPAALTSFTLSGVEIKSVHLKPSGLVLDGKRIGLIFKKDVPERVDVGRSLHLQIQPPADGDYTAALDAIFVSELTDLVFPPWWQTFAPRLNPNYVSPPKPAPAKAMRIGGGVSPPKVLFAPEPQFTEFARQQKLSGNVLIYLQVDLEGKPDHVAILRPVGLGLDDVAVAAVQQYKFVPAMENGTPVRVEMNVEINFSIR